MPHDNDRSYTYEYDKLNRLWKSSLGQLNNDGTAIVPDTSVALARKSEWWLDSLGNWTNHFTDDDLNGNGVYGPANGNGEPFGYQAHATNATNEIKTVVSVDPANPNGIQRSYLHDPAGNLVFDGTYVYQYDAWNP